MKLKILYLLPVILLFSTCSKDNNDDDDDSSETMQGFNDECVQTTFPGLEIVIDGDVTSELDPLNPVFDDYILCMQDCSENNPSDPECAMNCLDLLGVTPAGGAFSLKLDLTNTTVASITYVVEPGDWFEPGSGDYQPMMSPVHVSTTIAPGETETLIIPVYCLASERAAPDASSGYSMCEIVASNTCLSDIVDILETKDMSSLSFMQSMEVQTIIWDCTEGEPVDWDYLNNLP